MLKRIRELNAKIAQLGRNLREGDARLPTEEQLGLNLRRLIESEIPDLAGKCLLTWLISPTNLANSSWLIRRSKSILPSVDRKTRLRFSFDIFLSPLGLRVLLPRSYALKT